MLIFLQITAESDLSTFEIVDNQSNYILTWPDGNQATNIPVADLVEGRTFSVIDGSSSITLQSNGICNTVQTLSIPITLTIYYIGNNWPNYWNPTISSITGGIDGLSLVPPISSYSISDYQSNGQYYGSQPGDGGGSTFINFSNTDSPNLLDEEHLYVVVYQNGSFYTDGQVGGGNGSTIIIPAGITSTDLIEISIEKVSN